MFDVKSKFIIFILLGLVLVVSGPAWAQSSTTVQVSKKDGIGEYLADSKGMTLYYFKKDSAGKSACAGPCVENWPLFSSEKVTVPAGLDAKDFGVITREDGKKQTTYKGMPLYYFFGDKNPGDINGQGKNDVWYVINTATFKP